MPVLVSAVLLVGALCAVDLVLTLAVIRRLREHTTRLAEMSPMAPELASPGTPLGEFTATPTVGGGDRRISHEFFTEPTVVGVFSTTCPGCHERLPEFVDYLIDESEKPALVLVTGEPEAAKEFTDALDPIATVVVEPLNGPMSKALRVSRVPVFYVVDDNAVIVAAAGRPGELSMAVARA